MNGECNATNVQGKNYNLHKLQGGGARAPVPHSWWRHWLAESETQSKYAIHNVYVYVWAIFRHIIYYDSIGDYVRRKVKAAARCRST